MHWDQLLSKTRLRRATVAPPVGRNEFQQDRDRIVFSYAFRRLADKTQVHPLSKNDHVRTRLTHSIEVASVGRSLGYLVGQEVVPRHSLESQDFTADHFGYIVEAACLAHDLGNPPFGHSGEAAISKWFKDDPTARSLLGNLSEEQKEDFLRFEGNAQGFRITTNLESCPGDGGLQLTHAVLGAFSKYPCSAFFSKSNEYVGCKKNGFFEAEHKYFVDVAHGTGLQPVGNCGRAWFRHPLAFLTEAADDICYIIADLEDGFEVKKVTISEVEELLAPIAQASPSDLISLTPKQRVERLRARSIGNLIQEVSEIFVDHESEILAGTFGSHGESLLSKSKYKPILDSAKTITAKRVFNSNLVLPVEISGFQVIGGLLGCYAEIISQLIKVGFNPEELDKRSEKIVTYSDLRFDRSDNVYTALLKVTDYVSGMTDSYAVNQYQLLSGIRYH